MVHNKINFKMYLNVPTNFVELNKICYLSEIVRIFEIIGVVTENYRN